MVGTIKETLEAQKGLSVYQYVEIMKSFLNEFQAQSKKTAWPIRKTAPAGLFCMSGPVAHADDDEDGATDEEDDNEDDLIEIDLQMKKDPLEANLPQDKKLCSILAKESNDKFEDALSNVDSCNSGPLQLDEAAKQTWRTGCVYEGECSLNQYNGRGRICWPSGSYYEGEVMAGNLHGVGTFKGSDGTVYNGNWILNKKYGFGRKRYANGDVYEGAWKNDMPDGEGRYCWKNGSEYYGGWKAGLMSGKGVLSWASGDKYEGQWLNGLADGRGVYTWADGSTYFGTWRKGLKHGKGRYFPPGSKLIELERGPHFCPARRETQSLDEDFDPVQNDSRGKVSSPSHVPREFRKHCQVLPPPDKLTLDMLKPVTDTNEESSLLVQQLRSNLSNIRPKCSPKFRDAARPVPCEFKLRRRESLSEGEDLLMLDSDQKGSLADRRKPGEVIYKGHRSYELMLNLQLGIRHSVGQAKKDLRPLRPGDFGPKARTKINFPREGSQKTLPHQSADFKWKDYCPMVFRHLREAFKIDTAEYMLSICGDDGLRELSSPGKSGSVFYLSQDERFMIKTLRKAEVKVLLRMLPKYYNHVKTYRNTLLTKFYGLHRIKPVNGQKVRFIVMGNVVSTNSLIHRRFDLKGSSHGRYTGTDESEENLTTLKDLDLDFVFQLDPAWREAVLEQISIDCKFLESENIMDYSLLLGLHFKDRPVRKSCDSNAIADDAMTTKRLSDSAVDVCNDNVGRKGLRPSIVDASETERHSIQIGANMPALAYRGLINDSKGDFNSYEVYDVLLFFGVIDILQEYDMGKKLEHAYKSIQFDSLSISAVDPALYSKRFQHFIHEIFPAKT